MESKINASWDVDFQKKKICGFKLLYSFYFDFPNSECSDKDAIGDKKKPIEFYLELNSAPIKNSTTRSEKSYAIGTY